MEAATSFFHACEKGGGWSGCSPFCATDAGFTVQAVNALSGPEITACTTVAEYAEWQKAANESLGEKATYELHASAYDASTSTALFFATFAGVIHYVYAVKIGTQTDGEAKVIGLTKVRMQIASRWRVYGFWFTETMRLI